MSSKPLHTEFESSKDFFERISGRREVQLLTDLQIRDYYTGKRIIITGAGGTIGSSVARRLKEAGVTETFYLDRDESALHALALSLSDTAASHSEKCLVVDVRDLEGLKLVFNSIKPTLVIHTAALKHLVVLERFPREGYLTNVLGTLNVLQASIDSKVEQMLNVSTDKAALPTSVLGMTKLIAEKITQEHNTKHLLTSSVRFGNVFASRGSVIETFIHQLKNKLPVTITDSEATRFFMSHKEAANLILASCMIQKNSVFVQEMGERVRILDVVNRLGSAMGTHPQIKFIGLQPGEKLHEDLYETDYLPTEYPAIVRLRLEHGKEVIPKILQQKLPKSDQESLELIKDLLNQD